MSSPNSQQKAKATFPSAASITPRLVIDPTQTFECFDFETKIKQKYETALAIDKKELESILKDMEVLKEDFTLWSHGRIFHAIMKIQRIEIQ